MVLWLYLQTFQCWQFTERISRYIFNVVKMYISEIMEMNKTLEIIIALKILILKIVKK